MERGEEVEGKPWSFLPAMEMDGDDWDLGCGGNRGRRRRLDAGRSSGDRSGDDEKGREGFNVAWENSRWSRLRPASTEAAN